MASEHHVPRPQKIKLPPVPPSQLPQNIAPTKLSKGLQFGSFALATGTFQSLPALTLVRTDLHYLGSTAVTGYAVLVYDFGDREHCFMPVSLSIGSVVRRAFELTSGPAQIRRWFDAQTRDLFTLTPRDRQILDPHAGPHGEGVKPDRRTPIEFFKERTNETGNQDKKIV